MNKIFKVVWNQSIGAWVAVSELVKSRGKSTTTVQSDIDCRELENKTKIFSLKVIPLAIFALGLSVSSLSMARNSVPWDTVGIGERDTSNGVDMGTGSEDSPSTNINRASSVAHSIGIGGSARIKNVLGAIAIGYHARAIGTGGYGKAPETTDGSIALGAYAVAGQPHTGEDHKKLEINGENFQIDGKDFEFAGLSYEGSPVLSLGNYVKNNQYGSRQIQNVGAGRIAKDSTDAINGSQLYGVVRALEKVSGLGDFTVGVGKQNNATNTTTVTNVDGSNNTVNTTNTNIITVNNKNKHFDIIGKKDNYIETDVSGNNVTIALNDNATEAIKKAHKGFGLKAQVGGNVTHQLGEPIEVAGGNSNINTTVENGAVKINLNNTLNLTNGGSVKLGNTTLNSTGLTITGGPSVTEEGINAGNKKITNVANATTGTDAVNLNQLNAAAATAKTELKEGKNVTITKAEAGDKHSVYTINADKSVVKGSDSVKVTANPDVANFTTTYNVDLSEAMKKQIAKEESVSAGDNIKVAENGTNTSGGKNYKVSLNKDLNLTKDGSVTIGDAVLNNKGLTITNGPSVTKEGINAGGKNITNVANATAGTDAVNLNQLNVTVANAGFNLTSKAVEGTNGQTSEADNLTPDGKRLITNENFTLDAGNNIVIKQIDNGYEIATADNLNIGKTGKDGIDGTIGVNGKDGSSVVINGKDGSIGLTGPAGKDGQSPNANITVAEGKPTVNVKDGGQNITRIVYNTTDANGDPVTREVATMDDGLTFKGDNDTIINRTLGSQLEITGGANVTNLSDNNIGVVGEANGTLAVKLSKTLNLTTDGSVTIGDTILNNSGLTITNGPSITKEGINAGGKNITNVANATAGTDAVNLNQLNATVANAGFNLTSKAVEGTNGQTSEADNLTPEGKRLITNENFTLDAGNNIVIKQIDNGYEIATSNTLSIGEKGTDGKDGIDGTIGVNGKDGSSVVINGKDGSIGLTGPAGKDGQSPNANITVAEGKPTVNAKDGGQNITRIVYNTTDANGDPVTREVATMDDGLTFKGDNDTIINRTLGSQLEITGGANVTNLSDNNIGVVGEANGTLAVKLSKTLNLTTDGSVTIGDTVLNNSGLTITGGPSVTKEGINAGNKKITNVANATAGTDAVNLNQLNTSVANAGFNLTSKAVEGSNGQTSEADNLTPDGKRLITNENFTLDAGNNIVIKQIDNGYEIATADNLNIGKAGKDGIDGTIGVNGKDGSSVVINGKDGSIGLTGPEGKDGASIVLNGKDGSIGLTGPAGKDGQSPNANITVAEGKPTVNAKDGGQNITRIVYNTTDANGDPVTREVATMDDGLTFKGDNDTIINRTLGSQLEITGGANATDLTDKNIGVVGDANGTLAVKLSKTLNLTTDGSVTIGDAVLNNSGLTITNGPSITKEGINAGGKVITNVADGNVSKGSQEAINGGQLYTAIAEAGFNLTSKAVDGSNGQTSEADNLTPEGKRLITNENFTLDAGNNIVIKQIDNGYEIATSNTLSIGEKGTDGKDGIDGTIGVNGKDGSSVVINGKDGSIGLTGPAGKDGQSPNANITVAEGKPTVNAKDGGQNITRIVYNTTDANGDPVTREVATMDDGLTFKGDNETIINRTLGSQLEITGGANVTNLSDNNIGVVGEANGTLAVKLSKTLNLTTDGSVTIGDTVLNNSGLTITGGPSVTKEGINAGNKKITNVANATAGTDAVNLNQLNTSVANAGFNLTSKAVEGSNGQTSEADNLTPEGKRLITNENFTLDAGNNIVIKQIDNGYEIATSNTLSIGEKGADGKDGIDGTIGVNGKDGSSVVINGKDGSIGLTGPAGKDGQSPKANIAVAEGKPTVNAKDGGQNITRIVYNTTDANGDPVTREVATMDDGLTFKGDNETIINRTLGSQLEITGGANVTNLSDNNIGVVGDANGTLAVKLSKTLNLTTDGSVTIGDAVLNNSGLTITNGPSITKEGINAGGKVITNVADGNVSKGSQEAINGGQLYTAIAEAGFNLTSKAVDGTNGQTSEADNLTPDGKRLITNENFTLDAGNNIVIKQIDNGYEIATSNTLSIGEKGTDGKDGIDGTIGVNGKDGSSVVINGKDGSIELTGPEGKDGASIVLNSQDGSIGLKGPADEDGQSPNANITVAEGKPTVNPDDKNKNITRIIYDTTDANGNPLTREVATMDDGLTFKGDNDTIINRTLGSQLEITGGANVTNLSDNNIGVVGEANGTLAVKLSKNLNLTPEGSIIIGDSILNNSGLTITGGPSVTKEGINAGGKVITNVADGNVSKGSQEAINGGQLYTAIAEAGFNLTSKAVEGTNGQTSEADNLTPDGKRLITNENFTLDAGNNIVIKQIDNGYEIATADNLNIGKTGKDGIDGTIGVNGKDGSSVVINGKDGSIGLTGPAGKDGQSPNANITVAEGKPTVNVKDGGQNITRIVYNTTDANGDPVTREVATMDDGLTFKGDNDTIINRTLGSQLEITGGANVTNLSDNNIGVVGEANGTLAVKLSKTLNLTTDGSVTIGDTILNNSGLTITNGPSITKEGINAGGKNITNVANATAGTDAVNLNQLNATVANAGFNLTSKAVEGTNGQTSEADNLTPEGKRLITNENFTLDAGNNIVIKQIDNGYEIATSNTLSIGEKGTDGKDGIDGTIGVNGKDGSSVVINGKDGSIGLTGPAGKDGQSPNANITVAEGKPTVNAKDGGQNITRIVYNTTDANGDPVTREVATMDDGLTFKGDNDTIINRTLGSQLEITGGANVTNLSDNNIGVVGEANGTLAVKLSKNLNLTPEGSITIGDTILNNSGLTITGGPSVIKEGINAGNKKITNVTNATAGTDAVNLNQLNATVANAGFNLTSKAVDGTNGQTSEADNLTPDGKRLITNENFTLDAGNNIVIKQIDNGYEIATSNTLSIGEKGTDGKDGIDGTIGVNGKDGSSVVINGKDGSIGLTGPAGKDGQSPNANITVAEGKPTVNAKDGGQNITRIVYNTTDANGDPVTREVATMDDGLTFKGDNDTIINRTLGSQLEITGGANATSLTENNIGVVGDANGTLAVKLSKNLNLTPEGSITIGDTILNNSGLTITGGPSVTKEGINAGNKKITNVANATAGTDAVNLNQLNATVANAGFNLTSKAVEGTNGQTSEADNLTPEGKRLITNENFTLDAGNNIVIKQIDNGYEIATSNTLSIGEKGTDGKDGIDGTIGVNGKDGSSVVINGKDGSIGLTGPAGKDGQSPNANITVSEGKPTVNAKDGGQNITRIVYNTTDANGDPVTREVATMDDGLTFKGDNETVINRTLGSQLEITGGANVTNLSDNNIGVVGDANGTLAVKLSKVLNLTNAGSITIGDTLLNNNGLTITNGPSITKEGINAGNKKITHVTAGDLSANSTDAVNGSQLYETNQNISNLETKVDKGWNVTTSQSGSGKVTGNTTHNVKMGDLVTIDAGDNIRINQANGTISLSTSDTPTFENITVGKDDKVGTIGINGKDGANATVTVVNGPVGVNGKDGENGTTRIQYINQNGTTETIATLNDGLKFKGDDGTIIAKKLNETLDIKGGADKAKLTDNNIGVNNNNGSLEVKLSKDLNLTDKGSVTIGNTALNNSGLTITGGPSVTKEGINAGGKNITNVANATTGTDAVNLNQLNAAAAAAKTELKEGKNVTITKAEAGDKHSIYTINAEKSVVKGSDSVKVTADPDAANFTTTYNIDLSEAMKKQIAKEESVSAGDNNVKVAENGTNASGGKDFAVSLNKDLNLTKEGSITIGATHLKDGNLTMGNTTFNNEGITIKDGPSMTKKGINMGNKKITNIADGDVSQGSKEVINGGQLYTAIANSGFNLTTNGDNTQATDKRINNNETFSLNQGNNIVVKQINNGYEISTGNTLVIGGKGENGKDGIDGFIGVNGKDGSSIVINGKDGSIGLTGPKGADGKKGATITLKPEKGSKTVAEKDNGKEIDRIKYTDGNNNPREVATLDDGLIFTGDDSKPVNRTLGSNLKITGGAKDVSTQDNIRVSNDGNNGLKVQLANNVTLDNTGSINIGGTTFSQGGLAIYNGPSITRDGGLNAGDKVISNVARGVKGTDAVNVDQLNQRTGDIYKHIDRNNKDLRAGIAGTNAAVGLPQAFLPGKSMLAAAAGTYKNEGAIAVGYSRISDNGKIIIKAQGNANTRGDVGASAGIGYQW
ncbi:YadA-like family protein [Pelistega ratti]|uniref:YadA-like family protein n=1 Tax=Pelistega ratti TaxID=2652177 RepID=UPI0013582833|nr:YadA-like family protein [Pelistega ratti]